MKWWHWLIGIGGGLLFAVLPYWIILTLVLWDYDEFVVRVLLFWGGLIVWPALFVWICSWRADKRPNR